MHIAIARIKTKLRMLPIPRYAKAEKRDRDREAITPRLVLANKSEKVKRKLAKSKTKNAGIAKKVSGSTK